MAGEIPNNAATRPADTQAPAAQSRTRAKTEGGGQTAAPPSSRGDDTSGIRFEPPATPPETGKKTRAKGSQPTATAPRPAAARVETGPIAMLDEPAQLRAEDVPGAAAPPPKLDAEQQLDVQRIVFDSAMRTSPPGIMGFFHTINDAVEKQASQIEGSDHRDADRPTLMVNLVMQHLPGLAAMTNDASIQPNEAWSAEDKAFFAAARTPQGQAALTRVLDAGEKYQAQQKTIAAKDAEAVGLNPIFGRDNKRQALKTMRDYTDAFLALCDGRLQPTDLPFSDQKTAGERLDHIMRYFTADHTNDYAMSNAEDAAAAAALRADLSRYQANAQRHMAASGGTLAHNLRIQANSDMQYCLLASGQDGQFVGEAKQEQTRPYIMLRSKGDNTFDVINNPDAATLQQAAKDSHSEQPETRSVVVLQKYGSIEEGTLGGYTVMNDVDVAALRPAAAAASQQQPEHVALGQLGAKHAWMSILTFDAGPDDAHPPVKPGEDRRQPVADVGAAQYFPEFAPLRAFADQMTGGRSAITADSSLREDHQRGTELIDAVGNGNNQLLADFANTPVETKKAMGAAMQQEAAAYKQAYGQPPGDGMKTRMVANAILHLEQQGKIPPELAAKTRAWLEVMDLRDRTCADLYGKWGGEKWNFCQPDDFASSPFQRPTE